ncbi:MAG: hypothetical protein ABIJ09_04675 [Pseudomonadota bacterium]
MTCRLIFALVTLTAAACLPGQDPPDIGVQDPDGGATIFCSVNEQCPEGWTCLGGVCSDRECETKATCPAGKVCRDGWCGDPPADCTTPEDCPGDWVCEGFSRTCIDPSPSGCRTSFDCALEPGCENGCNCLPDGRCVPLTVVDAGPRPDAIATDLTSRDTNVTFDAGPPPGIDLGGYRIENREHSPVTQLIEFPPNTRLLPGGLLVVARFSDKAHFQTEWGVTLGSRVLFLNNGLENAGVPIINGGERWALISPSGTIIDGITITGVKKKSYQRVSTESAGYSSSWLETADTAGTPGVTSLPQSGVGLIISEWSDRDSDYFVEFIELYYAP